MTYEQAAQNPRSEKISLVTCEAVKPVKLFELYSGSIYFKDIPYVVAKVREQGADYDNVSSIGLMSAGTWFYDFSQKRVYVWALGGVDPKTITISLIYKFFFSNAPVILPHDLASGVDVEWQPLIRNIGSIGQQLDDENVGIVLESQSNVELINQGYFDSIFDSLIWENQEIKFYSWFRGLPVTEAKKIFDGVVESKDFSPERVNFKVKDYVFKLRNFVNLGLFSDSDGEVLDSILGTPKRRIYGQVKQAQCIPIDCIKDGYPLTGTVTINSGSSAITGSGTSFLSELSPGDEITFIVQGQKIKFSIDAITSNTAATLAKQSDTTINALSGIVKPQRAYRQKNRRWHIAGHKIRSSEAEIVNVINARQFVVDDNSEFFSDDVVTLNGVTTQVTRISGDQIVLEQSIFPVPVAGDIIFKEPITAAFFGENELILNRDFTLTNTTEAILELDPLAEFNIARERLTSVNLVFTFGSPNVDLQAGQTADLRTLVQPRDWIRKQTMSTITWYEILSVTESRIVLRSNYSDISTGIDKGIFKNVDLIEDDSLILVDCYGYDRSGEWMRTASDCVKHLVENDAVFYDVNDASFDQAKLDCPYAISMVIPEKPGEKAPLIRDVISKINESVFGSLYGNSAQEIAYSIVNTRRPETLRAIKDDEIISWDVESTQRIINQVKVNYSPFVDKVSGDDSFDVVNYTNNFVNNFIGIKNTAEKTCYLFNQADAEIIAERMAFYYSLSQSVLTLKAKANFFTAAVNDRVYVDLDRLYQRFGGSAGRKIGVISGIKKSPYNSEVVMNDLGNIFNRCHTFAPASTQAFTLSGDDEKIKYGFFLDGDTLTPDPDSEDELGSHLLG